MSKTDLYGGKSPYQLLKERDLLHGLTDAALIAAHNQHVEQEKQRGDKYNAAEARIFEDLAKNNPKGLQNLKANEPEVFAQLEENYLKRGESKKPL